MLSRQCDFCGVKIPRNFPEMTSDLGEICSEECRINLQNAEELVKETNHFGTFSPYEKERMKKLIDIAEEQKRKMTKFFKDYQNGH